MYPQNYPYGNQMMPIPQMFPIQNQIPNNNRPFHNKRYSEYNYRSGRSPKRNSGGRGSSKSQNQPCPRRNLKRSQNIEHQEQMGQNKENVHNKAPKLYVCPGCSSHYDCVLRNGYYVGKVPLILNCKHTVCQECIFQSYRDDNVTCSVCKSLSMIRQKDLHDNPQETFLPNFHVFGYILWSKSQDPGYLNLALTPVKASLSEYLECSGSEEKCCFLSCNKSATLQCQECNDVYCDGCCIIVHKSAKSLWSHKQIPVTTSTFFSATLEKCLEHNNMDIEFFCLSCELGACCYCLIEKHTGHEKDHLSKLSEQESLQLLKCKEKCIANLKQLLTTQKKINSIKRVTTSNVVKKLIEYFVGLFSRMQLLERNLHKSAITFQNVGGGNTNLENISLQVEASIEKLKNIIAACDGKEFKKLNLKGLLKNLEKLQNIPCYLVDENHGEEPINFIVDPIMENLEEYFNITGCVITGYTLVGEDKLPSDYQDSFSNEFESVIESDMKSEFKGDDKSERFKPTQSQRKRMNNAANVGVQPEMIDVTHIDSVDCFYVQQINVKYKLMKMTQDIQNIAKMASKIDPSKLTVNDLCLAYYRGKIGTYWCRGRLVEIKNGESGPAYEVFFIDYGMTQIVDISNIREIPSSLAQRKPFAIECELYNPTSVNWGKNAHIHMGKIIDGKEVFMLVKRVYSGVHLVDLMVTSSDRSLTSVIDILINTFTDSLSISSKNSNTSEFSEGFSKHERVCDYKIFSNSVEWKKSQIEDVIIANIVDPHHIFVHIAKYADSLKKLTASMKFNKKQQGFKNFLPVEGTFVVVEHKDPIRGNIHRALVKKVNVVSQQASVYCVDWGINVTVPWRNIGVLLEDFTKLEAQAIVVKLAHIEPTKKAHAWSEQVAQFLQKYFRSREILKMVVHTVEPLEVALFEKKTNVDLCINAQLVQENLADSVGNVSQKLEWLNSEVEQKVFVDDEFVSSLLRKLSEGSSSDSTDEETVVKQKIDVVKFVSPDLIYIKFICTENSEEALHNELQIYYFEDRKTPSNLKIDDPCVALYKNCYYRGKIIDINDDKYRVNLFDRALDVELSIENLFNYDKYFNKYPNVIFKAYLANIGPAGGAKWSMASIEAVQKIFETYQDIFATKVPGNTSNKCMPLKMWYSKVKVRGALEASIIKYKCINDLLVKLGYAYKVSLVNTEIKDIKETVEEITEEIDACENDECILKEDLVLDMDDSTSKDLVEEEEKDLLQTGSSYCTKEAEIMDWKPPFAIKDKEFYAWITCAETEGILYIRAENFQTVYKDLEMKMKEFFDNNKNLNRENHDWQPGQLCTIASGGFWYRGKIYKVNSPDEIVAIMIDYGSDHYLSPKSLYREILYPEIPAFASQIKLDRVYAKSGTWLTSDYETFLSIVPEYARIAVKGPLDVKIPIAEVYTTDGISINQLLVEKCPNLTRDYSDESAKSDDDIVVIEEELIECTEDIDVEASSEATLNDPTEEDSLPTNPTDTTSFTYKYEIIPNQERTLVTIMAIMTYNKIVLRTPKESLEGEISRFNKKIQKSMKFQPVIKDVKVGMPCVCPYSGDGLWYRAQIYNTVGLDCGYAMVFFVDFGNMEPVAVDKIKMMKPEWFDFPATCRIALLNFELKTPNHMEYVYQHIQKLFGKNKMCEVVSEAPLTVNIYDENQELNYQSLIQSGFIIMK